MTRYFSPVTGAFYVEAIHGARLIVAPLTEAQQAAKRKPKLVANPATLIPADAVAVEEDRYQELMSAQANGQQIIARGGRPVSADPLPPLPEAQLASIRAKRDRLLAATDPMVALPDYPVSPDQRAELLVYRQTLRDMMLEVDRGDPAGSVIWPMAPDWLTLPGVKA